MPKKSKLIDSLNPEQRRAVEHGITGSGANIAGPLLVIAGAGTGKTNSLAHRAANLIVHGTHPSRLLLMSFTRQAAGEMRRRVKQVAAAALAKKGNNSRVQLPWAGTFHSVGLRLLRLHAGQVGLSRSFTVRNRSEAEDQMDMVREKLGLADKKLPFPKKQMCLAIHSRMVSSQASLKTTLDNYYRGQRKWKRQLQRLFDGYVAAKRQQHVVDFDDLLLLWLKLLENPRVARQIAGRFDHVLVDEYQDTNVLQARILGLLKPDGAGLTVVGDDAQAIYSFRAAEVRNILDFPNEFTPPATVVTLEKNYRSTKPILGASNGVMQLAAERHTKTLRATRKRAGEKPRLVSVRDDHDQARFVAKNVLRNLEDGKALRQQAVLFRASHHSAALELELTRLNVPFKKFGGMQFLEAAHVKDVLSVLQWAENPRDQLAAFRVVRLLPGVGRATATKVLDCMTAPDPLAAVSMFMVPAKAAAEWRKLMKLLRQLNRDTIGWPDQIDHVCRWYGPHLERAHDDVAERAADLEQMQIIAGWFKSRRRFLSDLALDPQHASKAGVGSDKEGDYLTLSTIHSAKGREWRSVFILNVTEGAIPSSRAETDAEIEEERRLLYVAMTRAKDELMLVVPWQSPGGASGRYGNGFGANTHSHFISDEILDRFEQSIWPADANPHE